MSVIDVESWCPDHRIYFDVATGCETCEYEVSLCGDHIVPIGECGCKL